MITIEIGNIGCKSQAERLVSILTGKTYMNFKVEYSIDAGNYHVIISTENQETTDDQLKELVLFYLAINI